MPETLSEFVHEWHSKFPLTFDTKVLSFKSKAFYNTALGLVFEKVTGDEKFTNNLKVQFDTKNECANYDGSALLSHYHEAGYDAHMTGVAFLQIVKFMELDRAKYLQRQFKKNKDKDSKQDIKDKTVASTS